MHVNKALYTFSYTCLTAGVAGLLFAGIYLLVRFLNLFLQSKICLYFQGYDVLYFNLKSFVASYLLTGFISNIFEISVICTSTHCSDTKFYFSQPVGWCLWHQETDVHIWMDGNACIDDLYSDSMQHLANTNSWFLLERTAKQPCQSYKNMDLTSSLWLSYLPRDIWIWLVLYSLFSVEIDWCLSQAKRQRFNQLLPSIERICGPVLDPHSIQQYWRTWPIPSLCNWGYNSEVSLSFVHAGVKWRNIYIRNSASNLQTGMKRGVYIKYNSLWACKFLRWKSEIHVQLRGNLLLCGILDL